MFAYNANKNRPLLRKDVALCHTASRAGVEKRIVKETAHFMCTVPYTNQRINDGNAKRI
ncbi:MAG: hypothetical protein P4L69_21430 [Desulfosporosinus sp.]|nr:hypothetical protein [Desulfosporosinus sp.]